MALQLNDEQEQQLEIIVDELPTKFGYGLKLFLLKVRQMAILQNSQQQHNVLSNLTPSTDENIEGRI